MNGRLKVDAIHLSLHSLGKKLEASVAVAYDEMLLWSARSRAQIPPKGVRCNEREPWSSDLRPPLPMRLTVEETPDDEEAKHEFDTTEQLLLVRTVAVPSNKS